MFINEEIMAVFFLSFLMKIMVVFYTIKYKQCPKLNTQIYPFFYEYHGCLLRRVWSHLKITATSTKDRVKSQF